MAQFFVVEEAIVEAFEDNPHTNVQSQQAISGIMPWSATDCNIHFVFLF